jgi:hemin uptake protein HemP
VNASAFPRTHRFPDGRTTLAVPVAAAAPPAHDARSLTGPGGLAHIVLDGQVYSLRITRQGKLILTK